MYIENLLLSICLVLNWIPSVVVNSVNSVVSNVEVDCVVVDCVVVDCVVVEGVVVVGVVDPGVVKTFLGGLRSVQNKFEHVCNPNVFTIFFHWCKQQSCLNHTFVLPFPVVSTTK